MSLPYERSAEIYDRLYGRKPVGTEVEQLRSLVAARCPAARSLLDVGCGTGSHLAQLREWIAVEGLDASPAMLAVARRKLPDVPLHEGDMRSFALARGFDVVISLFSTIGYVRSADELGQAIATMARHLTPGGVLAVEPWFTPAQWRPGAKVHGEVLADADDLKIARFTVSGVRDRFAITPMHHLVATLDGVEHFVETHELFLAEHEEVEGAFRAAGLVDVAYVPELLVRGLWLGTRPAG